MNAWATEQFYSPFLQYTPDAILDANVPGLTKLTISPISFGGSWTSPAGVIAKGQQQLSPGVGVLPNLFLQNASPIALGTPFTEPSTGLLRQKLTSGELQWLRLGAIQGDGGGSVCMWIARVTETLTNYLGIIHMPVSQRLHGTVSMWRGVDPKSPFDRNFLSPTNVQQSPVSINTADANDTAVAVWHSAASGAGSGFALLGAIGGACLSEYQQLAAAQTSLSVGTTGGSSGDLGIVTVLHGTDSPPSLVGSAIVIDSASGTDPSFTVPSAQAGDYLLLCIAEGGTYYHVLAVGKVEVPANSNAVGVSPVCLVQNCIAANYNSAGTGGTISWSMVILAAPSQAPT